MPLPDVAQVERGTELHGLAGHALAGQGGAPGGAHLLEQGAQPHRVGGGERSLVGAHVVVLEVGYQHALGAEDRRFARHEERADVELARDRRGVQRAGAAGDDEREVAWIEAAAHAHVAHPGRHRHADQVVDACRGLLDAELERRCERLERAHGGVAVESHPAVLEGRFAEVPQDQVGIRHGRLRAAAPVAGRAGLGARALRADVQQAALVEPRDRAAARADRVDVDHRQREPPAVDDAVDHHERFAAAHERRVEARAAHVHGDAVPQPVRRELPQPGASARLRDRSAATARRVRRSRPAWRRRRCTASSAACLRMRARRGASSGRSDSAR